MLPRFIAWLAGLFNWASREPGQAPRHVPSNTSDGVRYVARVEQEPPGVPVAGILHLVADGAQQYWLGVLRCPCGCGSTIQLAMTPAARPCWQLRGSSLQLPSLWPSVRRAGGCRSHFILRQGLVVWCKD